MNRIQDFAWVTLITVLVWLYAEGRNVQTYTPADPVPVTIVPSTSDMLVTSQDPKSIRLQFKGATAEIDKLRQMLGRGIELPLSLSEVGDKSIVLADVLGEARPIRRVSVNVLAIDPPTMQIKVDRLVTQELPVSFKPVEVQLIGTPAVKPTTVKLTVPESKLRQLTDADLVLEAVPTVSLKTLPPGVEHTVPAQVRLPTVLAGDPTVKLDPPTVQLTFTIDKKEDSFVVPSVPVFIEIPPAEQENFKVVLAADSQVLRDVKVTGPAEVVKKVREGDIRIVATLRLFRDELDKSAGSPMETTAPVKFDVREPLIIESPVATVRYTVQKRGTGMP